MKRKILPPEALHYLEIQCITLLVLIYEKICNITSHGWWLAWVDEIDLWTEATIRYCYQLNTSIIATSERNKVWEYAILARPIRSKYCTIVWLSLQIHFLDFFHNSSHFRILLALNFLICVNFTASIARDQIIYTTNMLGVG